MGWLKISALIVMLFFISSCQQTVTKPPVPSEHPLRIMYSTEQDFLRAYGNSFEQAYPDIPIEIIPSEGLVKNAFSDKDEVINFIHDHSPDIITVNLKAYHDLVSRGALANLEPMIRQSKMDLNDYVSPVLQLLRDQGKGSLYGLTPHFNSNALYYNKTLFDQYKVPYPKDQMNWQDVLQLASRFPSNQDVIGFDDGFSNTSSFNPFLFMTIIAKANHTTFFIHDAENQLPNNPEFVSIFNLVIDGYRKGYLYNPSMHSNEQADRKSDASLFLQGKAAMQVNTAFYVPQLYQMSYHSSSPFEWDAVPPPIDPKEPDVSSSYTIGDIFTIATITKQSDAAWTFIQFIHSKQMAAIESMATSTYGFPILKQYVQKQSGEPLPAFYKLKAELPQKLDQIIAPSSIWTDTQRITLDALNGDVTTKEALKQIGRILDTESKPVTPTNSGE